MDARIEVEDLRFGYRGRPPVFKGINLTVREGELVGLIGPNGAGKTTLIELAQGTLRPSGGCVRALGVEASSRSPVERARVAACLPQRRQYPGAATVFDIIMSGRRPYRGLRGFCHDDERTALDAARRLDVADWLDRRGSELSGGEYQRVLLARVVAQRTPLLLCDEPASSLDPKHVWETFSLLRDLAHDDGAAVLASVHDLSLAAAVCDRLILIGGGGIIHDGTPKTMDDDALSSAYGTEVRSIKTDGHIFYVYGQASKL